MIGQPDPNCRWCKGTGKIPLFTSSCDCDCVNPKKIDLEKEYSDFIISKIDFPKEFIIPSK